MDILLPFQFPFMQNAFWACVILSIPTALLSCFVVTKGWALMGDAVSHSVLPGIVVAYLINLPLLVGAFAAGMFCAVATGYITERSRIKQDTVMGVVFSGMFGLGIVMFVAVDTNTHLDHILFGNLLGIGKEDLITTFWISAIVSAGLILRWKDLLLHSFDTVQAKASGLHVGYLHYGLLIALSATVVATLSATGLILAIGLLIAPGAIAFLMTRRFGVMLFIATAVCMASMIIGTYASFWLDSAPAPTIILVLTAAFLVAFTVKTWRNHQRVQRV
ncbi:MAG: metal ABC transporter permease [Planktomarina sp.]